MAAGQFNITIDQGSTFELKITMKEDGVVKDLTNGAGAALQHGRAQLRKTKESATKSASFTVTGTGTGIADDTTSLGTDGVIFMALDAATTAALDAGQYVYDLEITTISSATANFETLNTGTVTRVIEGKATVTRGITR